MTPYFSAGPCPLHIVDDLEFAFKHFRLIANDLGEKES
jgi:hypothetical protein